MGQLRPIFVGGCERSGTTLFASMLGGSPEVVAVPESQFLLRALRFCDAFDLRRRWERDFRLALWGLDRECVGEALSGVDGREHGVASREEVVSRAYRSLVEECFVNSVAEQGGEAGWFLDHTPENVEHYPALAKAFPEACFVHLVRDGRAVVNSVMTRPWGPNTPIRGASWWLGKLGHGLAAESGLAGDRIRRVHYEDLVSDEEATMAAVCEWLGIPFTGAITYGDGIVPNSYTSEQHSLVGGRVESRRASGWRQEMGKRDVEIIEAMVWDVLACLGYDLQYGECAQPATRRERLGQLAVESARSHGYDRWRQRRRIRAAMRSRGQGSAQ